MNQTESKSKPERETPSRSAYNLAAGLLFINALSSFILYYTVGITGPHMFGAVIDVILIVLLLAKNDVGRNVVLLRCVIGLFFGFIGVLIKWQGAASIEALVVLVIFFVGLMYILAGKTTTKHIVVGTICLAFLLFYHSITLFTLAVRSNFT